MGARPVIAIAGLACETSTFTPSRTQALAFHPRRGIEIIENCPFLEPGTELGDVADWRGVLNGHALPGGIVTREAFESLSGEIISRLTELVTTTQLDGLWFDIHGAMCVEGINDAEYELLSRIRKVIGPASWLTKQISSHATEQHHTLMSRKPESAPVVTWSSY